ncbi:MAG: hypothetical protein C5B53_07820 [Candidatus Melainabacteria bacterium]|nr:MAG: hypothetical protein C5B53_07820 [Candidatus Melainabacteria bacterium]
MADRIEGVRRPEDDSARLALTLAGLGLLGDDKPGVKGGDGKGDKKDDKKELTPEQAGKDLMDAAKKGDLGKDAKAAIEAVFKELRKTHKDDPTDVRDGLIALGTKMNEELKKAGSPNRINMGMIERKDGSTDYYMVLRKPGDKPEDIAKAIERGDKDSPTIMKAGTIKPKPKE